MFKARLNLTVVFFFVISQLPPLLLAGQPLQVSGEKNQRTIAIKAGVLSQTNDDDLQTLRNDIQAAIDDNETYQDIKTQADAASLPGWMDTQIKKQEEEAAAQAKEVVRMATELQGLMKEKEKRSDGLEKRLRNDGRLPDELKFGEGKTAKTQTQVLEGTINPIVKNPSIILKKIETEAKPFADNVKANITKQKKAWDNYWLKLKALAKRAGVKNANATLLRTDLNKIMSARPTSVDLELPPSAKTLLDAQKAVTYFLKNWSMWEVTQEVARIRFQTSMAKSGLENMSGYLSSDIQQIDNLTYDISAKDFGKLSQAVDFFRKIPQEKLSPQMQKKIQAILDAYPQLEEDFPKKKELLINYLRQRYQLDDIQNVLDRLASYRERLIKRINDIKAGKPLESFPLRPAALTTDGTVNYQLPDVIASSPPALEPFDSLLNKTSSASQQLQLKIAFQLGRYPREGKVNSSDMAKGNLLQKNILSHWPSNFVIKDDQTAGKFAKDAKLGNLGFFYNGIMNEGGDFFPPNIWIVAIGNSIADMTVTEGKLTVTLTDDPTNQNSAKGLFVHIVRVEDLEIAAAIAGGAAIEYVHALA